MSGIDTKMIKSMAQWAATNAGMAGLFVAAYHLDIEGARNVFLLLLWALLLPASALLLLSKTSPKEVAKEPPTPIRSAIGRVIVWLILLSLAWQGHIITALGWGAFMLCGALFRFSVKKEREAMKGAAA